MRSWFYQCGGFTELLSLLQDFLNDYGLIWVGDTDSGDPAKRGRSTSPADLQSLRVFCMLKLCCFCFVLLSSAETSGGRGFHINFDLVLQRIRELNILLGEGESFVQMTATGAQLAKKDPIPLRLYRNGIVMFDGPFRSYQEHSTQVSYTKKGKSKSVLNWNLSLVKSKLLVPAAVHARSNGRLFSIWASRKISGWCTFWGESQFLLLILFLGTTDCLHKNSLCSFMTGDTRNSTLGSRGKRFLVKDRLFVGTKMNQQARWVLTYPVCSKNVTLIKAAVQILRDFAVILMFSSDSKARSWPQISSWTSCRSWWWRPAEWLISGTRWGQSCRWVVEKQQIYRWGQNYQPPYKV